MSRKLTWAHIYKSFRKTYPNLRKHAVYWHPHDEGRIVLYLDDGSKMVYDHDLNSAAVLDERWKE